MHRFLLAVALFLTGGAVTANAESHYLGISFHQGETVYFDLAVPEATYEAKIEGTTLKITPTHTADGSNYSYEIANINRIFNTTEDVSQSSIKDLTTSGSVITPLGDNKFAIALADGSAKGLTVYGADGRAVGAHIAADGANAVVDLSSLNHGVYVINFGQCSLKVSKR